MMLYNDDTDKAMSFVLILILILLFREVICYKYITTVIINERDLCNKLFMKIAKDCETALYQ